VPVTLIVRELPKEHPDDEEEVTVESIPNVPFAMRCVDVPTAHVQPAGVVNHDLLYTGPLRITLGDRRYEVQVRSARKDLSDAQVILSDGKRRQVLYSTDESSDEPHFDVEWAGDLDGDEKLDLVVNLSRKYSWHPHCLLLSSMASETELVGETACFETGC
jgi:nucleoid-associated protein YgaU